MNPTHFLVCDLESTHKIICSAEIITAAFIVLDLQYNIIERRLFKMAPTYWTSEHDEAVRIHGITREQAFRFPPKKQVMIEIRDWLNETDRIYHLTGHFNRNMFGKKSSFDYALLNQQFFDIGEHFWFGQKCPASGVCSTHTIAEHAFNEGKIHVPLSIKEGNKKASRDFGLKSIYRIVMGKDLANHHDAEIDANAACELLLRFKDMVDIKHVIEFDWRGIYELV